MTSVQTRISGCLPLMRRLCSFAKRTLLTPPDSSDVTSLSAESNNLINAPNEETFLMAAVNPGIVSLRCLLAVAVVTDATLLFRMKRINSFANGCSLDLRVASVKTEPLCSILLGP